MKTSKEETKSTKKKWAWAGKRKNKKKEKKKEKKKRKEIRGPVDPLTEAKWPKPNFYGFHCSWPMPAHLAHVQINLDTRRIQSPTEMGTRHIQRRLRSDPPSPVTSS
jgi:hypothetical protein